MSSDGWTQFAKSLGRPVGTVRRLLEGQVQGELMIRNNVGVLHFTDADETRAREILGKVGPRGRPDGSKDSKPRKRKKVADAAAGSVAASN